eukprot:12893708-Prorocentrum_lima.AAC.1
MAGSQCRLHVSRGHPRQPWSAPALPHTWHHLVAGFVLEAAGGDGSGGGCPPPPGPLPGGLSSPGGRLVCSLATLIPSSACASTRPMV